MPRTRSLRDVARWELASSSLLRTVEPPPGAGAALYRAVATSEVAEETRPPVQITVSVGAPAALVSVAATAVLGTRHMRGCRR
ncbi:hypothetical protein [Streptomyces sp. NPDC051577]|uniref:hypothetical protein n=1 Tax=Streptomyces sp. NPDC051577 TaxID=3155166 RepID=UPI0034172611